MDEKTTTRLGIVCSLVGMVAIYAASASARPKLTPITSLDNSFVGLRVSISGQVIDYREHKDGHLFLKLQDSWGGVVSVPIFSRTRAQIEESIELLDIVEVTGEVVLYQGEFEVIPEGAKDLKVIHTAPVTLTSLTEENAGTAVKVQGTIVEREIVGNGNVILTLSEDGGQLPVFIPSWIVEDGLPEMHVGDMIRVDGWVQLYNGELELKVVDASHLHVVEAA
ncbi:MAG: OB-fold nucleic acid binding domain-containing protein [Methanobacteriota archaeon]